MPPRLAEMPPPLRSLSARLLVLTIFFVMLAEVLIFAPSIARFRLVWFEERIAAGHLATLALKAAPDRRIGAALEQELLDHVGGYGVILYRPGSENLVLSTDMPPVIDRTIDLAEAGPVGLIVDAFMALTRTHNRVLKVVGPSPTGDVRIAVVLDETPLRHAMYAFSQRILLLSIVISVITAALVYLALYWLMVLPMRRITESMIAFRDRPERAASTIAASARRDEIGIAERELAAMQSRLRAALRQRRHLAALGEAVAKINHDLRNMLAGARLMSERLSSSPDPTVQRALPLLEQSIDRAADLCARTLKYVEDRRDLALARFGLAAMLREAGQLAGGAATVAVEVADDLTLAGDREELFRAFANLIRNAAEAGATRITLGARAGARVTVEVADDGPGMPPRAVENLFRPFAGSARAGGTGLGLAIAREIVEAHGGTIALARTGAEGTLFRVILPGDADAPDAAAGNGAAR